MPRKLPPHHIRYNSCCGGLCPEVSTFTVLVYLVPYDNMVVKRMVTSSLRDLDGMSLLGVQFLIDLELPGYPHEVSSGRMVKLPGRFVVEEHAPEESTPKHTCGAREGNTPQIAETAVIC